MAGLGAAARQRAGHGRVVGPGRGVDGAAARDVRARVELLLGAARGGRGARAGVARERDVRRVVVVGVAGLVEDARDEGRTVRRVLFPLAGAGGADVLAARAVEHQGVAAAAAVDRRVHHGLFDRLDALVDGAVAVVVDAVAHFVAAADADLEVVDRARPVDVDHDVVDAAQTVQVDRLHAVVADGLRRDPLDDRPVGVVGEDVGGLLVRLDVDDVDGVDAGRGVEEELEPRARRVVVRIVDQAVVVRVDEVLGRDLEVAQRVGVPVAVARCLEVPVAPGGVRRVEGDAHPGRDHRHGVPRHGRDAPRRVRAREILAGEDGVAVSAEVI